MYRQVSDKPTNVTKQQFEDTDSVRYNYKIINSTDFQFCTYWDINVHGY